LGTRIESGPASKSLSATRRGTLDKQTAVRRNAYVQPAIRNLGDLVDLTATLGSGRSAVPQGASIGNGCQVVSD